VIEWVAITVIACMTLYSIARIYSKPATMRSYREAGKVKDEMNEDLKARIRSLKGRLAQMDRAPEDIEGVGDIGNIVRHLPRPLRPFAKPIIAWAGTDEGKEQIGKLIKKWAASKEKGAVPGAPGGEDSL
jgi:hypothetical protein